MQCNTNRNITCITGQYDYTCLGHIHWDFFLLCSNFSKWIDFEHTREFGQEAVDVDLKAKVKKL